MPSLAHATPNKCIGRSATNCHFGHVPCGAIDLLSFPACAKRKARMALPSLRTAGAPRRGFGLIVGSGNGSGNIWIPHPSGRFPTSDSSLPISVTLPDAVFVGDASEAVAISSHAFFNLVANTDMFCAEDCEKTLGLMFLGICPKAA